MNEARLRDAICEVGRRIYACNLVAGTDGNMSVKLAADRFLCTRSGVSKGFMTAEDIVVANGAGEKISGSGAVSTEFFTHLAAYEVRDDIAAVVHAHPVKAVALTLTGRGLADYVLPEVVYSLGSVPTARYATPGTREGADVIRELIRDHDAVLLARHGAVTVGGDVFDAYTKMEKLEHAAETIHAALLLGTVAPLHAEQVRKLLALGAEYAPAREVPADDVLDRL